MANAHKLRKLLMSRAEEILILYLDLATGKVNPQLQNIDRASMASVWDIISGAIKEAKDPVPTNIVDGTVDDKLKAVLYQVSVGEISTSDAGDLIRLLVTSLEITELPKLMEKLAEIEQSKKSRVGL